jgi:hypothetical protein
MSRCVDVRVQRLAADQAERHVVVFEKVDKPLEEI